MEGVGINEEEHEELQGNGKEMYIIEKDPWPQRENTC